MPSSKTRRYSIEIKDIDDKSVLFTYVDWNDEEVLVAIAQVLGPPALFTDDGFTAPSAKQVKTPY
jgi:hypothetical protein